MGAGHRPHPPPFPGRRNHLRLLLELLDPGACLFWCNPGSLDDVVARIVKAPGARLKGFRVSLISGVHRSFQEVSCSRGILEGV